MEVLGDILRGGIDQGRRAGVVVLGGHTVNDEEIKYGMAVTGVVHPDRIWRNVGAQPGDALVLTKALGTGIVTTARKRGAGTPEDEAATVASMLALNAAAARALRAFTVHACTDVSGFSLLGHGFEMAHGSGVRLALDSARLPLLPGARSLVGDGGDRWLPPQPRLARRPRRRGAGRSDRSDRDRLRPARRPAASWSLFPTTPPATPWPPSTPPASPPQRSSAPSKTAPTAPGSPSADQSDGDEPRHRRGAVRRRAGGVVERSAQRAG